MENTEIIEFNTEIESGTEILESTEIELEILDSTETDVIDVPGTETEIGVQPPGGSDLQVIHKDLQLIAALLLFVIGFYILNLIRRNFMRIGM